MTKYRFKTEAEFVKEFGDGWKSKISNGWNHSGEMDYLFNTPFEVNERELKKVLDGGSGNSGGWAISKDMITPMDSSIVTVSIDKEESIKVQVQSFSKLNDSLFK